MSKNITKRHIIQSLAEDVDCTQVQVKMIIQKILDGFVDILADHQRIELRNFGVFEVKKRRARVALNPRTQEKVMTSAKYVVVFTSGREMSRRVNECGIPEETPAVPETSTAAPAKKKSAPKKVKADAAKNDAPKTDAKKVKKEAEAAPKAKRAKKAS